MTNLTRGPENEAMPAPLHTTHVASDQDTATLFDTDPGMLEAFIVNAEPSLFTA